MVERIFTFPPFRFEVNDHKLWSGDRIVPLRAQCLVVLRYLLEHADLIVTKDELLTACWPNTLVSSAVVRVCIREIRAALEDEPGTPHFIETIPRRGYRFIAPLTTTLPVASSQFQFPRILQTPHSQLSAPLVGRETELGQLHRCLEKSSHGEQQLVFITGEPGIGKTALVGTFLQQLAADARVQLAYGQCVEYYGTGEPYLPVLEAVERLCQQEGERLVALLRQHAPMWLAQMPSLLKPAEREQLQREIFGAARERMLREASRAVEVLTANRGLVLVLEDLQWSDPSTVELLSALARPVRGEKLLLIGTYRPSEILAQKHPLQNVKSELQLHGQCQELPLPLLTEDSIAQYLALRFSQNPHDTNILQDFAALLYQQTEGNPLFMVSILQHLEQQQVLLQQDGRWAAGVEKESIERSIPESIEQFIVQQFSRLSTAEQQLLETASVAGAEFSVAALTTDMHNADIVTLETCCTDLARRLQFLQPRGTEDWPDGTVAARYGFVHALYQEVLYNRIPTARRSQLHNQIGKRKEQGYQERAEEIAAELALHFAEGRNYPKAVHYLSQAGQVALRRYAHQEAIAYFTKGLELLKTPPKTPEHTRQELLLNFALAVSLSSTKGFGAAETAEVYTRVRALSDQFPDDSGLFQALQGEWALALMQGALPKAQALAQQIMSLAESNKNPTFLQDANMFVGVTALFRGELTNARRFLEKNIASAQLPAQEAYDFFEAAVAAVACRCMISWVYWLLGSPNKAIRMSEEALALAQKHDPVFSLTLGHVLTVQLYQLHRDETNVAKQVETAIALARKHGMEFWVTMASVWRGWVLAEQGQVESGIRTIRSGLEALGTSQAELVRPYFLGLLAEALGKSGQHQQGQTFIAEALEVVEKTEAVWYKAELFRLKGDLTLHDLEQRRANPGTKSLLEARKIQHKLTTQAKICFDEAIKIAREQKARSLELRATTSLARLWQQQGKTNQAHKVLSKIYNWFTEGFDTKDLQEAKGLLEELR